MHSATQDDIKQFALEYPDVIPTNVLGDLLGHPFKHEWVHKGFGCRIERKMYLGWCGYIDTSPSNINEAKIDYDKIQVHGGLTSGLGFDCSHNTDVTAHSYITMFLMPSLGSLMIGCEGATYKDFNFAKHETEKMASQIEIQWATQVLDSQVISDSDDTDVEDDEMTFNNGHHSEYYDVKNDCYR
jgi:hypothetical protein